MNDAHTRLNQAASQLLHEIFDAQATPLGHTLAAPFGTWLASSKPFLAFAQANLLKIRKKVRVLRTAGERDDLACELHTAYLLLSEPKFAVTYEPKGKGRGRSADFAVTFRTHTPFHVEVTRLRPSRRGTESAPQDAMRETGQRLANAVCEKLGQFAPETPNVLWVWGAYAGAPDAAHAVAVTDHVMHEATHAAMNEMIGEAMAALKRRAEQVEPEFYARYGFAKRAEFIHHLQRLNAILLQPHDERGAAWWANNDTRHTLPAPIAQRLRALAHGR